MTAHVSVESLGRVQQPPVPPPQPEPTTVRPGRSGTATAGVQAAAVARGGAVTAEDMAFASPAGLPGDEELPAPSRTLLARTTEFLNQLLQESRRRLKFNVHEATGRIWVQVIDAETQEVIKEIPPERYLDLVARIWALVGILVDEKA